MEIEKQQHWLSLKLTTVTMDVSYLKPSGNLHHGTHSFLRNRVTCLVKKMTCFHVIQKVISISANTHHCILSWAGWIQSTSPHVKCLHLIDLFLYVFPTNILYACLCFLCVYRYRMITKLSWLYTPNCWGWLD